MTNVKACPTSSMLPRYCERPQFFTTRCLRTKWRVGPSKISSKPFLPSSNALFQDLTGQRALDGMLKRLEKLMFT